MPAELQPPSRTTPESATNTDPTTEPIPELFPYETDHEGTTIRAPRARGVLTSNDPTNDREDGIDDGEVGSTACPECGGETINGAGLFACQECTWTGSLR